MKGIISAGHPKTVEAAETILKSGGNAFDAALAALYTSCVVEPVLSSLGGGGFLLAKTQQEKIITYDFFTQSPITKKPISEIDFYPIIANFGSDQQEFHIGLGSIATPGMVKGIFEIHRDLCQLPMNVITQPAIEYAKKGVILNKLQAYIFDIVKPIYTATDSCRKNYSNNLYQLPKMGDCLTFPNLAETFEWLSKEGDQLFYQHDIAKMMVKDCQENGGYLKQQDLTNYQVYKRNGF